MRKNTQVKFDTFMTDLTKAYGEGATITGKQLMAIHGKNRPAYPHNVAVSKNPDFKVAHGHFLVTMERDPKKLAAMLKQAKDEFATKQNATALAKTVAKELKSNRKGKAAASKASQSAKKAKESKVTIRTVTPTKPQKSQKSQTRPAGVSNEDASELDSFMDNDMSEFRGFANNQA